MSRALLIIFLSILSALPMMSNPRWKMHTTFDGEIDNLFETPDYVYFTSRAMADMNDQRRMSLFRYDKEGDELQSLSTDNYLTSNTVAIAQYNPHKGYVVVVSNNYDITFLYDDGSVVTMADYRLANISGDKGVNAITLDPWQDRIYLSTKFGYISINDKKYEIAESRTYGSSLTSAARIGDVFVIIIDSKAYQALAKSPRLSLEDYTLIDLGTPYYISPLTSQQGLIFSQGGNRRTMLVEEKGGDLESRKLDTYTYHTIGNNSKGVIAASSGVICQIEPDGVVTEIKVPTDFSRQTVGSYDMSQIWCGKQRKGIASCRPDATSGEWTVTRDYMMPNAPSPFVTPEMVMHPSKGVLVPSYGFDYTFSNYPQDVPALLSGYKDGWWTNYAPAYFDEKRAKIMTTTNGVAVDPDNPDYVYMSSVRNGFIRLNLTDAQDIIHFSKPADSDNGNPGFVVIVENQQSEGGSWQCNFSTPRFDSYGNMWMVYVDMDNQTPARAHLFCWEAADRRATTSADNVVLPKRIEVMGQTVKNISFVLPLKKSAHKDIVLYASRDYSGDMALIDTNGTPTDDSDDSVVKIAPEFHDQDGTKVDVITPRYYWEDPSTGYVWVCHSAGVFYFNPSDFLGGKTGNIYRTKVARNDGTNLADYLLDNVVVNNMTTDGSGRKWFATGGGGIVVTSSDGRTIEEEINTSNSPIPSDAVYGLMYIPSSNSMLISTSEGIAEYYLTAEAAASGDGDLKIYPNPVRPDYFGYVTIEGLPDRSIVKIVDASGNIVKEFGPVSGDVQWDVTNHQFKRVSSGVYFVLASAGENESAFSTVGKILVVN